MNAKTPIDFWFDFSSPYSYIASEWIDALAARHGRSVRWHSILLGATFQAAELRSPVAYPLKRDYVLRDFARSARFEGVPYLQPTRFPIASHNAARLFYELASRDIEHAKQWARCGLRAYFTRGVDLSDTAALTELATAFGIERPESIWSDQRWKDALRVENDAAIAAGVFGAPFFSVDGEPFWGNDRKGQLAQWLQGSLRP
ncbi:MAG: 2-hydroxychromene-2-carboxylate isomerase [Burkholderiales bacterium]|nr:2-hydroxychromene-2-carboxylate isomerase [Burkholderiales bacterium]